MLFLLTIALFRAMKLALVTILELLFVEIHARAHYQTFQLEELNYTLISKTQIPLLGSLLEVS